MIYILVILEVKDFNAFELFEQQAAKIMEQYQGRIISAFETRRETDNSGEEIHVLEFPDEAAFSDYRSDSSLAKLADLRSQAILKTEVKISYCMKNYDKLLKNKL